MLLLNGSWERFGRMRNGLVLILSQDASMLLLNGSWERFGQIDSQNLSLGICRKDMHAVTTTRKISLFKLRPTLPVFLLSTHSCWHGHRCQLASPGEGESERRGQHECQRRISRTS